MPSVTLEISRKQRCILVRSIEQPPSSAFICHRFGDSWSHHSGASGWRRENHPTVYCSDGSQDVHLVVYIGNLAWTQIQHHPCQHKQPLQIWNGSRLLFHSELSTCNLKIFIWYGNISKQPHKVIHSQCCLDVSCWCKIVLGSDNTLSRVRVVVLIVEAKAKRVHQDIYQESSNENQQFESRSSHRTFCSRFVKLSIKLF